MGQRVQGEREYPAVSFDSGTEELSGQLLWFDSEVLGDVIRRLDSYEDHPRLFRRVQVQATTAEGQVVAYSYEWSNAR